jgi:hypothetical protein
MYNKTKLLILTLIFFGIGSIWLLKQDMNSPINSPMEATKSAALLPWPLEKSDARQKLLKFGMYVTPDLTQNPISPPERFTGYHTGLDIEILPEEKDLVVTVKNICEGKILFTGTIEGYGGVIIQECNINSQPVSVLYGHLKPTSIKVVKGEAVIKPETAIADLGDDRTEETGNTRKHLHLGIHKGNHIEFLGYVTDQQELSEFIDPLPLLQD